MLVGRWTKLTAVLLAVGSFVILSSLYLYAHPGRVWSGNDRGASLEIPGHAFWQDFLPLLEKYAPDCPSPQRYGSAGTIGFNAVNPSQRPDLIVDPDSCRLPMQQAHDGFIESIRKATNLEPMHVQATSGIVSSAGGSLLPVFVTSLRMLRRAGSTLPVELFVKDWSEYEDEICKDILPTLNARCIVLSDVLDDGKGATVHIAHYQIKIFAVLSSSFENVIWMDADCFPLHDPRELLRSEPFTSNGLVTWPDFWASTASPLYFDISRQEAPAMDLRASSETGVFLVSKKSHLLSLLLAAYYNFYGPSHYFTLLSQGAPGEGDKETFIHAASALGQSFYTVSEPVRPIGHPKVDGKVSGSAMVQADPVEDFKLTSQNKWRVKDPSVAKAPRVFFIHAHYPKFNPGENLFGDRWETAPTLGSNGDDSRAWTVPEETLKRFGYDAEKAYWEEIKWTSCNLEGKFGSWKNKHGICNRVQDYWENVFGTHNPKDPSFVDNS
ncbi:mannosyltransferase [Paecilomyces lecythidis]|uniref:Mannosyltransferase n=1 Tax=Paecilomyces lecythidis TaxID=3004212 RepID=A0ABR3Y9U0_9EURO